MPPLRVTTHLVEVNVIVQDKKGEPVTDRKREDFALLDQGHPEEISAFSIESLHTLPGPAQLLPANFYTNRLEQRTGTPTSVTVILLDRLNTKFADMAYARAQIMKSLSQLQPQDRVAVYTLTTSLKVLHTFTSDSTSLLRAIQNYKGHSPAELEASEPEVVDTGNDQLDDFLNAAN